MNSQKIKLLISLIIPLIILMIPLEMIPMAGITIVEQRLMAIFAFAVISWVLEPIPVFATSILIIFLELIFISNKSLLFMRNNGSSENFGELLDYKAIMATFASPIILLFLGGFFLAMAATKFRLDTNLARVLLKPFGKNPKWVMLGLMGITALFSMFMSNTATTAMMLAVLAPILKDFPVSDKGRVAFVLAIPFAANIGGMGTPIGTPPNAVAQKYLVDENAIAFGEWMLFAVPYVIIMLIISWAILTFMFPTTKKEIVLDMKGKFLKTWEAKIVYLTFAGTILLWLIGGKVHGMTSHIIAMLPVAVFCATGIITTKDLKMISWDVLWLVSGGIALGLALGQTGLSQHMVQSIPFESLSPWAIVISASFLAIVMSTFMSNTATANLILPMMMALGTSLASCEEIGGAKGLIIVTTFACSLAMAMPISTPPNALAHSTGFIKGGYLAKSGIAIGVIGLILAFGLLFILQQVNYL